MTAPQTGVFLSNWAPFVICGSMYCLCVNVYCTTATGCLHNCSWQIYKNQ